MNDKALWQQFQKTAETTTPCLDLLQLSAYMDKRLDKKETEEIETHLNHCDECLESMLALFEAKKASNDVLPMSTVISAQELVEDPVQVSHKQWNIGQAFAASLLFGLIAFGGYITGKSTYETNDLAVQIVLDEDIQQFSNALESEVLLFSENTTGDVS